MLVTLVTVKRDLSILNYYGESVKVGSLTVQEITQMLEDGIPVPENNLEDSQFDVSEIDNITRHFEF